MALTRSSSFRAFTWLAWPTAVTAALLAAEAAGGRLSEPALLLSFLGVHACAVGASHAAGAAAVQVIQSTLVRHSSLPQKLPEQSVALPGTFYQAR